MDKSKMKTNELLTIYHNPRCSKSRQTLQLIQDRGATPIIVEYLKIPPTIAELSTILEQLKLEPMELVRKGEDAFKTTDFASQDRDTQIKLMTENPILIERPIVSNHGKALIGRPPESVLSLLDE